MGAACSDARVSKVDEPTLAAVGPGLITADDVSSPEAALSTKDEKPAVAFETREASNDFKAKAKRRCSVSAEVMGADGGDEVKVVIEKSDAERQEIRRAIRSCFIFDELDEVQLEDVVAAMFPQGVKQKEVLIQQGAEGDNFYVIRKGTFRAIVDGVVKHVYEGEGAFGELALLYNCPRAATVEAYTDGDLWGVDRSTFRRLILVSMMKKRENLDSVLKSMDIFLSLSQENIAVIADCLSTEVHEEGKLILREGEHLSSDAKFYVVESGSVDCFKTFEGERKLVQRITAGGFFGEVALVSQVPRQADCVAACGPTKLLCMGRVAFERLMGPVEAILADRIREYEQINQGMSGQDSSATDASPNLNEAQDISGPADVQIDNASVADDGKITDGEHPQDGAEAPTDTTKPLSTDAEPQTLDAADGDAVGQTEASLVAAERAEGDKAA